MEILFTKTGLEEDVLSCKRKNGTVTWGHISKFFILHDLCHYAVETTLPLKKAFLGMLAEGTDITEFELPKEQRKIELTQEALLAEHLVNLVVIDYTQGRMDNLLEILTATYNDISSDLFQLINEEKLEHIRNEYAKLIQQWQLLPERQSLKLLFEE